MNENRKKVLEMLAEKKISADEASRLLDAMENDEGGAPEKEGVATVTREKPRYLRVNVFPDPDGDPNAKVDRVNVKVPLSLVRAGIKLTSLIPPEARDKVNGALREKGIDFDVRNIKSEDLEELIEALGELEVDVLSSKGEKVKVFVE